MEIENSLKIKFWFECWKVLKKNFNYLFCSTQEKQKTLNHLGICMSPRVNYPEALDKYFFCNQIFKKMGMHKSFLPYCMKIKIGIARCPDKDSKCFREPSVFYAHNIIQHCQRKHNNPCLQICFTCKNNIYIFCI